MDLQQALQLRNLLAGMHSLGGDALGAVDAAAAADGHNGLASVFFVGELMTQYKTVASITYLPLQPLVVAGIIYFVLNFILSRSVRVLERRLMVSD